MAFVDDAIELAAAPPNIELELGLQLLKHVGERSERKLVGPAAFDPRYGLLADVRTTGEVSLPPAATPAKRPNDAADTDRMHRHTLRSVGYPPIACAASARAYAWDQSHIEGRGRTTYGSPRSRPSSRGGPAQHPMSVRPQARLPRPSPRATVLLLSAAIVLITTAGVAVNVSDHLRQAAVDETMRSTEAVVLGYMGTTLLPEALADPTGPAATEVNSRLEELTRAGQLLRIKVWTLDGTVAFSDLPALRGRNFGVADDLEEVFDGETSTEFSAGDAEENEFEHGLAERFLSIYSPIRTSGGEIVGAYEVYEDAAPIDAAVDAARRDVVLFVGAMAAALLTLIYVAFAGASRLLTNQNRRLREQAVTEQLLTTDLRRSEERFRSLVRNSADVNVILGRDGTITYESPAVERVLGYRPEDRIGRLALDVVHPEDRLRLRRLFLTIARRPNAEASVELRARHADGSWRAIDAAVKNLIDDPAVGGLVVNYRDVTPRKTLEDELRLRAFHDSLTGLANRALFIDRLQHALARSKRSRHRMAVLFLDLDDFKTINDSLGHGEGDQVLVATAERLQGGLRAGDTIARMGGDEFAVLLEDTSKSDSPVDVAERLLATLQAPFTHGDRELFVRASVGVALIDAHGASAEELLRDADAAMYIAKGRGKNRVVVFEPGMHRAALTRLSLKGDLERALERQEFRLVYQPIIDLSSGDIAGAEALLRWHPPSRRSVLPSEFIPLAEETGLIIPLGSWVVEEACREASRWSDDGRSALSVNVNVSGRQVAEPDFPGVIEDALRQAGLDPGRLVLEFTENVLIDDRHSEATLAELKALGVRLAIDDFGTGFSSLGYLRRFPIDVLKIDGSFVANLAAGHDQRELVRAIVRLGETLHLETVAEGIETSAQAVDMRAMGATRGQGHYFSYPLEPADLAEVLEGRRPIPRIEPPAKPALHVA
jgi:diguanylate cyclase (GGDEF)-like protein/PAS domain S-box-containing protein